MVDMPTHLGKLDKVPLDGVVTYLSLHPLSSLAVL